MANIELGAINTTPTGGVTPVRNSTYQVYNYTFVATASQEYVNLLFRNDPGFTWLDDVAVVAQGDPTHTNLLTNGGFEAGGEPKSNAAPMGWTVIGGAGVAFAGALGTAAASIDQIATPHAGTYFWVDGATNAYDGLAQRINLTVGVSYTLSFALAVDPITAPQDPIDTQVWLGEAIQTAPVACFARGTHILAVRGEVRVEALAVGDLVVTLSGHGAVLKPIAWIGSTAFDIARHPSPDAVRPIRIAAGALGEGVPHRDLRVSPGHSLMIDGVLMQAERLLNGATIARDMQATHDEYFHVELAEHDVVLSEGAPSETYLDTGNRQAFARSAGLVDLHPDFSPRHWTQTCVTLIQDGPRLTAARQRLIERAQELGWRRREAAEPQVLIEGRSVPLVRRDGGRWAFAIPAGAHAVRIVSEHGRATELLAHSRDDRELGLWIDGLAVIEDGARRELALDADALTDGWHGVEQEGSGMWRWTDGDAGLDVAGACELEISVGSCLPCWRRDEPADAAFAFG